MKINFGKNQFYKMTNVNIEAILKKIWSDHLGFKKYLGIKKKFFSDLFDFEVTSSVFFKPNWLNLLCGQAVEYRKTLIFFSENSHIHR